MLQKLQLACMCQLQFEGHRGVCVRAQECNLYQFMKAQPGHMSEAQVRGWVAQILGGLAHIHAHGYFHRDLKPGAAHSSPLALLLFAVLFSGVIKA